MLIKKILPNFKSIFKYEFGIVKFKLPDLG